MSEFNQAYGYARTKAYFWPLVVLVTMIGMWGVILLTDPRREFDVAMVNAGQNKISDAKSWCGGRWYVGVGSLRYGVKKTHSSLVHTPPKSARVSWKKGEVQFDRLVEIPGTIPNRFSKPLVPRLLVEIDSDCGRVRVSWKRDYNEMSAATPYKHVFRDCSIYNDRATPADAPPWPPNW